MRYLGLLAAAALRVVAALRVAAAVAFVPQLLAASTEEGTPATDEDGAGAIELELRTGEINAHDVNIRAGAHLNYEIVAKLDKGDLVLVKTRPGERPGDWARIAMPPGTLIWVSSEHVANDGIVESTNVNVRSGPGLNYNLICQVQRDERVIIKATSTDGKWYGIEPPEQASAWVYTKYVTDKGDAALYTEWAPRKAKCMALLASADHLRDYELKRPEADIRFAAILEMYGRVESDYADMPEARTAKHRIREVERIQKSIAARLGTTTSEEQTPAAGTTTGTATETTTETATETATETQTEPEPKYLKATGVLREISKESSRKGLYRVTKEDRWLCIVKSGTLDLGAYVGKSVEVIGLEAPSEGWSLRTINVSRVRLVE
jgi:uncharacterized protein YgiM (DUF1202 family)